MKLVLFSTYGSSLKTWDDAGILERELALYQAHAENSIEVHIITYGDKSDQEFARDYDFITIHCNKWGLHPRLYAVLLPYLHHKVLKEADLYKTNQLFGAHIASKCAILWKKLLVVRQGYGHYEHRVSEYGKNSPQAKKALLYEKNSLHAGRKIIFTSKQLADRAIERHGLDAGNVHVVPNYIVADTWSPVFRAQSIDKHLKLVFFGRYTEQKNLDSLLIACKGLPAKLTLIGEGPLKSKLQHIADENGIDCQFIDRQNQSDLPRLLSQNDVFILPSHYEGHPKSLLEAMAYGMPILAANSPGIKEQVTDGETGILAPTTVDGLRAGIEKLIKMPLEIRQKLGDAARIWSLENFSVQTVATQERKLFEEILS